MSLGLLALFLLAVAITGPFGDFPLNDDWSFGTTARKLAQAGFWDPTNFPSMPLITNALWGWPFCRFTACSFTDLRASTLVAALLLGVATFALIRMKGSPLVAGIGAAAVMFNPIGYALSFTFMTDVLFWTLFTASAVAFLAALERDSVPLVVLGTAIAVAATLSRQLAPAVPLAYGLVRLLQAGPWPRKLALAILPAALCALALQAFDHWLVATGKVSPALSTQSEGIAQSLQTPALLLKRVFENLTTALLHTGLFSLPVLLLTARPAGGPVHPMLRRLPWIAGGGAVLIAAATMVAAHRIMPFGKNVLVPEGIGPLTLRDTYTLRLANAPALPRAWWLALTLFGLAGAFALVDRITAFLVAAWSRWRARRLSRADTRALFALLALAAYGAPLIILSAYDRYFVLFLPFVFLFLASSGAAAPVGPLRTGGAVAAVLVLTGFSIAAVHDYLAWNNARWTAIADLQAAGVPPERVDGGVEHTGLTAYESGANRDRDSWWLKQADDVIAFGPIDGLQTVRRYPFRTYLPPFDRSIVVLGK